MVKSTAMIFFAEEMRIMSRAFVAKIAAVMLICQVIVHAVRFALVAILTVFMIREPWPIAIIAFAHVVMKTVFGVAAGTAATMVFTFPVFIASVMVFVLTALFMFAAAAAAAACIRSSREHKQRK